LLPVSPKAAVAMIDGTLSPIIRIIIAIRIKLSDLEILSFRIPHSLAQTYLRQIF